MRRLLFWLSVSVMTFVVGVGAYIVCFQNESPGLNGPEPVQVKEDFNCLRPKNFPGRSQNISDIVKGSSGYFPKKAFHDGWENQNKFINDWYGKHLRAMKEPSLLDVNDEDKELYRFLWLRSFHHPIAVTIERDGRSFRMVSHELSGAGGYEPGRIFRTDSRILSMAEWCEFVNLLEMADYWNEPTNSRELGADGAEWVLEGVKSNHYHIVDRWSPREGNFRNACIYLLKLSGRSQSSLGNDLY